MLINQIKLCPEKKRIFTQKVVAFVFLCCFFFIILCNIVLKLYLFYLNLFLEVNKLSFIREN